MSGLRLTDRLRHDIPASVVVFFVATPLCLGIALASGAPLFAGVIAGIVGGIVVGLLSGSSLGVSGPAAGLAVIVLDAIGALGSWQAFLVAVILAGAIQIVLGFLRCGVIAYYFPSSVIKGMLAGIGLTIILKQLPHAVGYDGTPAGVLGYVQADGENTFSAIGAMFAHVRAGAIIVTLVSLALLVLWEQPFVRRLRALQWLQGPVIVVGAGIAINALFKRVTPSLAIQPSHLVQLPVPDGMSGVFSLLTAPDFSQVANPAVYTTALTLAIVASLETLLCVEATDRLDPLGRNTPADRELKAQGVGNVISGLLGGLPVTQVIVRSSANIQSGARTKLSTISHGILLLVAAVLIPQFLNLIPLATLAAILFAVGFKLAKPALFQQMYKLGWHQFAPFALTIVGILTTDLLVGIGLGMSAAVFFILLTNYRHAYFVEGSPDQPGAPIRFELSEDVSFLNRASLLQALDSLSPGSRVVIDASRCIRIDYDCYEILTNFHRRAASLAIDLTIVGLPTLSQEHGSLRGRKPEIPTLQSSRTQPAPSGVA